MKTLVINDDLARLSVLIRSQREQLLSRWRQQVRELPSAQLLDTPTLTNHIPQLLDQFALGLETRSDETIPEALEGLKDSQPPAHGVQRVIDGFDIAEVVAEYNILRGCIHDLADNNGLRLQGRAFRILNRVFDEAIGSAVRAYASHKALEVQQQRGEYLAFVAHDLRTPLSAISLATRVLDLKLTKPNASASLMLKVLHRNLEYLDKLVGKVLEENTNLSTELGIRLERRSFDLWPLVAALIYDLKPVAGTSSTRLINEVPDDLVVYADAGLLKRVFQNLIANAIRYTPSGKISIGGREIAAGAVECWVRDNGAGISPELLEKVFAKSVTGPGNDEASGSGLGLSIVSTFVEAHGGKVTVESNEKTGSTFRFTLPGRE